MRRYWVTGLALFAVSLLLACGDDSSSKNDADLDGGRDAPSTEADGNGVPDGGAADAGDASPSDDGAEGDSGDDAGELFCTLVVATINGEPIDQVPQIDSTLDLSDIKPGFQVDVGVQVIGAPSGTSVALNVTGVSPDAETDSVNGVASFSGVTVNSAFSSVELTARAVGCVTATVRLDVQPDPTCQITAPEDGSTLTAADDVIEGNDTFEVNVVVDTNSRSIGGVVRLRMDGRDLGTENVTSAAEATFENIIFGPAEGVKLEATLTLGALSTTCEVTINVDIPGPSCEITSLVAPPKVPVDTSQGPGLGPNEDADSEQAGLQTTITVTTDNTATTVTLRDGSTQLGSVAPSGGSASFPVTLADGAHVLSATCADSGGTSNRSDASVLVDITKPVAVDDLLCFTKCLDTTCPSGDPSLADNRKGLVTCNFGSVDGTGSAVERYLLRYRLNDTIDESKWTDGETQEIILAPRSGVSQSHVVPGFQIPNSYGFAVKAVDVLGNESDISNLPAPAAVILRQQSVVGAAAGDRFGWPIVVGDFNCDDLTDVAVGSQSENTNRGAARIFAGSPDGLSTTPMTAILGSEDGALFASGFAALDFDGDGCDDLAVIARRSDERRGRVYLYLGRKDWPQVRSDVAEGTGAEVIYALPLGAETATQTIGRTVAAADIDGDGKDDLAIPHWETEGSTFAQIAIDYGDDQLQPIGPGDVPQMRVLPGAAELLLVGGRYEDEVGAYLARGGLLDRGPDTEEELLIGAWRHEVGSNKVGAVYVLRGGPRGQDGETIDISSSARVVRIFGDAVNEGNSTFGVILAGVGDLDGDGIAEFAVSDALRAEGGQTNAGKIYLFNLDSPLPASSLDADAVLTNSLADSTGDLLGRSMANGADIDPRRGADLNNDLLPDLLVGTNGTGSLSQGAAYVFLGQLGQLVSRTVEQADTQLIPLVGAQTSSYSISLTFLGDVNGDGFVDVIVGDNQFDSRAGRVVVFN